MNYYKIRSLKTSLNKDQQRVARQTSARESSTVCWTTLSFFPKSSVLLRAHSNKASLSLLPGSFQEKHHTSVVSKATSHKTVSFVLFYVCLVIFILSFFHLGFSSLNVTNLAFIFCTWLVSYLYL